MIRINVKLGGINLIPDPQDASFLTDPVNPTMVMGRSRSSQSRRLTLIRLTNQVAT